MHFPNVSHFENGERQEELKTRWTGTISSLSQVRRAWKHRVEAGGALKKGTLSCLVKLGISVCQGLVSQRETRWKWATFLAFLDCGGGSSRYAQVV